MFSVALDKRILTRRASHILPVIIFSQFAGTSLWFSGNAVVADLQKVWNLSQNSIGHITSAIQLGFISGTLVFALLTIADRYSPRMVFFWCSFAGSVANLLVLAAPEGINWLVFLRFTTGFFLAGIYPVGMKIAAGWFEKGLGRALGYLVGALVLGAALPHFLRASGTGLAWQYVIAGTSALAVSGGIFMLLVPDGPYLSTGGRFNPYAIATAFKSKKFRASAFGYFGHMWELYTLWAFIPVWLLAYSEQNTLDLGVPLWSFAIVAVGFIGCAAGGMFSQKFGSAKVAAFQLLVSGVCCILSAFAFNLDKTLFLIFMLIWGVTVIGDSPQFSALNAKNAPPELVGSALTIVNSIGFLITVFSIQIVNILKDVVGIQFMFWLLIPGPVLGLMAIWHLVRDNDQY